MSNESELEILLGRAAEIRRLYNQERDPNKRLELRERYRCIDEELAATKYKYYNYVSSENMDAVVPGSKQNHSGTSEIAIRISKQKAYLVAVMAAIVFCGWIFTTRLSITLDSRESDAATASLVKSRSDAEVKVEISRSDEKSSSSVVPLSNAGAIELTTDNPSTLIGTNSKNYSIGGLRLGMSHDEAWRVLEASPILTGKRDSGNSERIYVYTRNADGAKGESALYLIWKVGEVEMERIVFFPGCRHLLSANFSRLLTLEAIDPKSRFRSEFIGYEDWAVQERVAISDSQVVYVYERIGLKILDQSLVEGHRVIFSIHADTQ